MNTTKTKNRHALIIPRMQGASSLPSLENAMLPVINWIRSPYLTSAPEYNDYRVLETAIQESANFHRPAKKQRRLDKAIEVLVDFNQGFVKKWLEKMTGIIVENFATPFLERIFQKAYHFHLISKDAKSKKLTIEYRAEAQKKAKKIDNFLKVLKDFREAILINAETTSFVEDLRSNFFEYFTEYSPEDKDIRFLALKMIYERERWLQLYPTIEFLCECGWFNKKYMERDFSIFPNPASIRARKQKFRETSKKKRYRAKQKAYTLK